MSIDTLFLLALAGAALFAAGLYVEHLTRPRAAEAKRKAASRRVPG
ncbi:hypothetical protein ACFS3C_08145 [Azotobacter vinelandii]|nr:hypothetical protein [Azotobacter vinelandii]WKN23633.1 hypothetical protein AVAEIV_001733 [Azotobacter vinelandii]SFY29930.1 hypothetical protein SAMN04244547_04969 [Azotobacter vinelandii]